VYVFYTGGHMSYYMGGLSKLHHKCVTDVWKRLKDSIPFKLSHNERTPTGSSTKEKSFLPFPA